MVASMWHPNSTKSKIKMNYIPYFREFFPRKLFFFWIWPDVLWPLVTVNKSAETIQGRKLFKGGNYSRKYGIQKGSFSIQIWRTKKNSLPWLLSIGTENWFSQPTPYSYENFGHLYFGIWGIVELVFALLFEWMILFILQFYLSQSIYLILYKSLCILIYLYLHSNPLIIKKLPMYIFLDYYLFWRL